MEDLFNSLSHALNSAPGISLGAAFVWGILSVVLSPCHLSSIPLIVGFINGQGKISRCRAFAVSSLFALGILLSIAFVGIITATAGRILGDVGRWTNYVVAGVFFVVGLHLVGVIPMPLNGPGNIGMKMRGMMAAFVLGLIFGIALGPCTFAYMAPVLATSFKVARNSMPLGLGLLLVYGIGHCSVIVAAGTATNYVQRFLNWNQESKGVERLKVICGIMVLAGGLYLIYTAR
jgi:cytochrome c-type biogenesis protein